MNKRQLIIGLAAIAAIFWTLSSAQWHTNFTTSLGVTRLNVVSAPIWDAPDNADQLLVAPLILEWTAILGSGFFAFWICRSKPVPKTNWTTAPTGWVVESWKRRPN
jgi:hypothetical protein